jgi:hypothetical protein
MGRTLTNGGIEKTSEVRNSTSVQEPLVIGMNPRIQIGIRIQTTMSWSYIHNTATVKGG